jgi:hypothetical protein
VREAIDKAKEARPPASDAHPRPGRPQRGRDRDLERLGIETVETLDDVDTARRSSSAPTASGPT